MKSAGNTIGRVLTSDMPCVPYKEHTYNTNQHRGQLKLFLGELEFLMDYFCEQRDPLWAMKHTLIVYAGAAPGNHLVDLLFWLPGTYWHLYDPCEFDDRLYEHPNVRCFQTRFTDAIARDYSSRKTIFISDIRSAVPDKSRHYSRYAKQEDDIEIFKKDENMKIPENIDYSSISGLSNEIRQKLELIRPKTFGQASRIEGITPAAINLLLTYSKRYTFKHTA